MAKEYQLGELGVSFKKETSSLFIFTPTRIRLFKGGVKPVAMYKSLDGWRFDRGGSDFNLPYFLYRAQLDTWRQKQDLKEFGTALMPEPWVMEKSRRENKAIGAFLKTIP